MPIWVLDELVSRGHKTSSFPVPIFTLNCFPSYQNFDYCLLQIRIVEVGCDNVMVIDHVLFGFINLKGSFVVPSLCSTETV